MNRLIDFVENIILKLIDKMNIVFVLLILILLGIMNKAEVIDFIDAISGITKGLL